MASQAAILRAARAVPGGARPTPPPQGANIGMGQISPLAWNLAEDNGYSRTYGPFLPRPARTFTSGAFGPFPPILPVPVDEPPPGAELPDPRRFDYEVGWNLPVNPGLDGYRMASFPVLETLSRLHSITRTCVERRKAMITGLDYDIVPTKEAAKAYQGDHAAMRDFGKRRAEAVKFIGKPDPNYDDFSGFLSAILEQVFVYDAMSILLKPKRGRGLRRGILGSDLDCIEQIDGASIRPLLSLSGGRPRPPAPGYQQFLKSVPRCDLQAMWDERDIEAAGLRGYEGPVFAADQLVYRPIVPRVNSPYGFSCVEMALLVIMTGLRKQAYQLEFYSEGTVPACFVSPGDINITPTQLRELQEALNGYANDTAWHHKIIVLPPGARVDPMRPADLADQFDEFLANEIAMVFDVDPMSIGLVPTVSTTVSPFAAKEMAQASRVVHERTSTRPLLKFLCSIVNAILHRVCGQDDMKFTFAGMDEAQDQAAQTDMLVKQVQSGLISIDEAREELQRTAWGLDETSGPLVYTQMGPVPLNQVVEMLRQMQPMQSGHNAPANAAGPVADTAGSSHQPRAVHHPPSSRPVGTHNPRLGLPSGPSGGADIQPQRARASDTPAHSAAQAHTAAGRRGKAADPGGKPRAVKAELESLLRHLRKGRNISGWEPIHLSGQVMAVIAEDLTKGLAPEDVIRDALTVALPPGSYEWLDKASAPLPPQGQQQQSAQQRQAQQIAQQYATQIQAVFGQVAAQASALIAQWLSGALAVTAAALAGMIAALIAKLLGPVLAGLWAAAWKLGADAAGGLLGVKPDSGSDAERDAWVASHGRDWVERIADTHSEDVAAGLDVAARAGEDAETITGKLLGWLDAAGRPVMIAVDQVQRAMIAAMMWLARKLGVVQKRNVDRGDDRVCARCRANTAAGWVNFSQPYPSGQLESPFHTRCRCRQDLRLQLKPSAQKAAGGHRYVDLPGQEWWPADSYPSGPAMGGGGRMHPAHDGDGIEQYIPGGVPGMTAGGEPPRWPGSGADPVVASSPRTDSAGRGNVQTRGGGTAGGPYRDFSHGTRNDAPEDADDALWPGERGRGADPPQRWPVQGYMGGYWPTGGHGTSQSPVSSPGGGGPRGRAPNAYGKAGMPSPAGTVFTPDQHEPGEPQACMRSPVGKASGYSLNPRSGMISLDLPEGVIEPVPGGVDDHHITVVYLGPDVDDEAFALACLRASAAAALLPGPLAGVISGIGTFPASASSDGKVPVWAGVMFPGAEVLREALEDLSASEHKQWKPHVTLAYVDENDPLPGPVPPTAVTFTHLSVHRGDQVQRFQFGVPIPERVEREPVLAGQAD